LFLAEEEELLEHLLIQAEEVEVGLEWGQSVE